MVTQKNNLFRKEALEHSSSPERLDRLMQVVSPKKWPALVALDTLVVAGLTWSVVSLIPITVMGKGVLVYPSKIVGFESPTSDQLLAMNVRVGDFVKKGEVLATINQAELQKQRQQQRVKLADLEAQNQNANSLQSSRSELETKIMQQQRLLQAQSLTPIIRDKDIGAVKLQRQNLQQRLQEAKTLAPTIQKGMRLQITLTTVKRERFGGIAFLCHFPSILNKRIKRENAAR